MARGSREPATETIGQRLRRLRLERGLSQRALSEPGVSYAYISRIEADARSPSVKALRMLARKLGVSPDYLETGRDLTTAEDRELRLTDAELELRLSDDVSAAEEKLARLLDEATAAGDVPSAVHARIALGLAAARQGRQPDAVSHLEQALASDGAPTPDARPDVYLTLGHAYSAMRTPERAVELFERALDELADRAPTDIAARTRFATYLSYALSDAGDLDRAHSVLTEALEAASELDDPYARVRLYWSLARLTGMQGQSAAALRYARRAIALLEFTEDTLHLARAHLLCAVILMTQEKAEQAAEHLSRAEQLFGPHADRGDLASLRTEQAKQAAFTRRADDAVKLAREALELLEDSAEQGGAWWALAEGLAIQGEVPAANEAFRRAVDTFTAEARWLEAAQSCRSWGGFLKRHGNESEAAYQLERAADLDRRRARAEAKISP